MQTIALIFIIGISWWMLSAKFDLLNKSIYLLESIIRKLKNYKERQKNG